MFQKIFHSILGFIIGALLGSLVGIGELNQTKKSIREETFPFLLATGAGIGAITGLVIGYNFGYNKHVEEVTGIKNSQTHFIKQGRFWVASTVWTDIRNQKTNQLLTGKSSDGILISEIDERAVFIHPTTSGSRVNVEKYHNQALSTVFSKLKKTFAEEIPRDLIIDFPTVTKDT